MTTKTADSVRATITEALSWVTIPSVIEAVTPAPGFDLDPVDFARRCGTIYLIAPGGSATAPLFRAFTAYVQYEATLAGTRWAHKKLIPPLLLALDELHANPVPLPSWLADSAGKGVQIAAVVHDVGQLEELYGVAGARTVWGTTGTKIFFGGIHSDETLEKVCKLCGKVRHGSGETARGRGGARRFPAHPSHHARIDLAHESDPCVVKVRPVWKRWDRRLWRHAPVPWPLPTMPQRRCCPARSRRQRSRPRPPRGPLPATGRPRVSDPRDEGFAALAAQVADLRSVVTKWDARLQTLGLDGSLDLTAELARLAELVSEDIETSTAHRTGSNTPTRVRRGPGRAGRVGPQRPGAQLRHTRSKACWRNHPSAVWELSTLRAEWERIYNRPSPLLAAALTWLDRWLPGAMRRVAAVTKDCTAERCTKGAAPNTDQEK